jgi:UDP-N-acetylmuramoyl-L-alanyl-D-glutamate--2,6-diaminopimelate ligase
MTSPATPALRPEHPVARSLSGLVRDFALDVVGDVDDVEVTGVTLSSGDVQPGDLYVGLRGAGPPRAPSARTARASPRTRPRAARSRSSPTPTGSTTPALPACR